MPMPDLTDEEEFEVEDEPTGKGDRLELVYAANLLARPDLLKAVVPDLRSISDPTARAMLQVVQTHGEAYAKPATLLAALEALPQTLDGIVAQDVLLLV